MTMTINEMCLYPSYLNIKVGVHEDLELEILLALIANL